MRLLVVLAITISMFVTVGITGCGKTSQGNETIAQVKKVQNQTPWFCYNHVEADLSLGIMRNGVGSMSTQDMWVYVPNTEDYNKLVKASKTGQLVSVKYDVFRVAFCVPEEVVTSVDFVTQ